MGHEGAKSPLRLDQIRPTVVNRFRQPKLDICPFAALANRILAPIPFYGLTSAPSLKFPSCKL
jgi:hypothetical protein